MSIQNLTGQTLGQYELRQLLGIGGMGAVYRGYQVALKREVAVKVLAPQLAQQAGYIERFNREAETAAALEHRNIIPIHDYGTQRGVSYVVMRLLTGGALSDRLALHTDEGKPLPSLGEVVDVLKQLASALDYAHSQGVIHRDIKPSNVMFDNQGSAYLVDFGIAKLMEATHALTGAGVAMGTPSYMSPEQWKAESLTPAADQYALGVMAYTLVTGRVPFEAPTPYALMNKHLNEMPTPPQTIRPDLPLALTDVLNRAMAKHPADRFPTCTAFAQAFDRAIRGNTGEVTNFFTAPVRRKPVSIMTSSTPSSAFTPGMNLHPIYRNPLVWGMGIVILIMAAVIAFMAVSGDGEKETARETPADTQAALAYIEAETATKPVLEVRTPTITLAETPRPTDPTVPSSTPIATPSSAPSETPAITLTFSEVEKEATIQAAMNARLTLTATQWTLTPTITPTATEDLEATADARLAQTQTVFDAASTAAAGTETQAAAIIKATNNAEAAETQFALDQTATAILWTATPTVTPSPTLTATFTLTSEPTHIPTVTPDLLPFALERAQNFSGNNDDWEPFVQEFNSVKMVLVPPGCFMMGSDSGEEDQKPVHEVCFEEPFWIDRTEVTTAQYGSYNYNWPQASVTWVQARNFCDRRGGRLPTEAEWEYAARGPEGWVYPWGNEFIAENVVYLDRRFTSDMYIEVVGSRQRGASWVGALDMSGNVWEWVSTIYQPYPYNALDGRENDTDSRSRRVVRGGAASVENQDYLRTTYRSDWDPSIRSESGGFRCARSADETSQTIASAEPTSAPTFVADALQEVFFPAGSSNHDWMPMIQEFDGVQMVLVPAGCFEMGGTEYDDEKPVHRVCFEETFWIDRTEVTNGQFVRFNGQAAYESYVSDGDRPRENITWIEAQAFCESRGARLPTEAEWEYVARGPEGWKYSWGNEFDDNKAIWNRSINDRTAPVGSLPVGMSWVGTLDMSGNVWEWVADWYGETYYASLEAGVINPTGPETGEYRVLRGGSWADEWDGVLRAAFRGNSDTLGDSGGNMGFRCARSFDESVPPPVTSAEPPPVADASQEVFFPAGSSNRDWTPMIQTFDGVEMVLVPAGCFEMGSESGDSDEYPVHQVCFDEPFWIGRTEVTNGQFAALNGHGQFADSNGQAANSSYFSGVDRPREQITWAEANAFCESRGARLPTEAEWEYAARGPEAWVYPWGDEFDSSQAIWNRGSSDGTASVGSLPAGASWVGALDMSGNVWEWVADWYGENYYSGLADGLINPAGPASGENRVLRGGSWNGSSTYNLRAAFRWPENPSVGDFDGGFRCARSR